MGRSSRGCFVFRRNSDAASGREQAGNRRPTGRRSWGQPHGRASQSALDRFPLCLRAEHFHCGDRLGLAFWFCADSFRRRPRSLLAGGFGQAAQEVCDALRRADRACEPFRDFPWHEFCRRWSEGSLRTMLDLAVVLQLVPYLYMHGALLKLAKQSAPGEGYYSKTTLVLAGSCGLITTILGISVAFIPSHQIESIRLFEIKMSAGTLFFVGLAAFFFFVYGRRKAARKLAAAPAL